MVWYYLTSLIGGLLIGSFVGVLVDRIARGEQFLGGRSYCDHCQHQLRAIDLIPLFSFLALRGRCRYCDKKLSWWLPATELLSGLAFLSLAIFFTPVVFSWLILVEFFFYVVGLVCFLVILLADLKYHLVYDVVLLPLVLLAVLRLVWLYFAADISPLPYLATAVGSSLVFGLLKIIADKIWGRAAFGLGDVKLVFVLGLFLGWPEVVLAFYIAFLTGAAVGVILVLVGKKNWRSVLPFGPFLLIGAAIVALQGQYIIGLLKQWLI